MLDLIWQAQFKDKSTILQYDTDQKEHMFREVLNKQDDLELFALFDRHNKIAYLVNLEYGYIAQGLEGSKIMKPRADMLRKSNLKYRLIYFREVERTMGASLQEIAPPKITYFLGFQYTDENNKNHKRMIHIHPDGRWVCN